MITITQDIYNVAKDRFLNSNDSVTTIAKDLNINRKKLSSLLKEDNIDVRRLTVIEGELQKQILSLYDDGYGVVAIENLLREQGTKITRSKLSSFLEINTCYNPQKTPLKVLTKSQEEQILDLKDKGFSLRNISRTLHISEDRVKRVLQTQGYIISNRKHTLNEDIFEKIDNEEKAYWLGFMYADGYVYNDPAGYVISLGLKQGDKHHIEKYKTFIGSSAKIYDKEVALNNNIYISSRIDVSSKKMVSDLVALGCVQCKSLVLTFPNSMKVPFPLVRHFIRGYFDGDGCVCKSVSEKYTTKRLNLRISFIGTQEFLQTLSAKLMLEADCKFKNPKCNGYQGKAYDIAYNGNLQCEKIYNYLYKDATIYLERKKEVFDAVFEGNCETSKMIKAE